MLDCIFSYYSKYYRSEWDYILKVIIVNTKDLLETIYFTFIIVNIINLYRGLYFLQLS